MCPLSPLSHSSLKANREDDAHTTPHDLTASDSPKPPSKSFEQSLGQDGAQNSKEVNKASSAQKPTAEIQSDAFVLTFPDAQDHPVWRFPLADVTPCVVTKQRQGSFYVIKLAKDAIAPGQVLARYSSEDAAETALGIVKSGLLGTPVSSVAVPKQSSEEASMLSSETPNETAGSDIPVLQQKTSDLSETAKSGGCCGGKKSSGSSCSSKKGGCCGGGGCGSKKGGCGCGKASKGWFCCFMTGIYRFLILIFLGIIAVSAAMMAFNPFASMAGLGAMPNMAGGSNASQLMSDMDINEILNNPQLMQELLGENLGALPMGNMAGENMPTIDSSESQAIMDQQMQALENFDPENITAEAMDAFLADLLSQTGDGTARGDQTTPAE